MTFIPLTVRGEYALIPLGSGAHAIVDVEDAAAVAQFRWRLTRIKNKRYASRGRGGDGSLHREVMGHPAGKLVDHRDGDGLNNRRGNLRVCTHTQNMRNSQKRCNNRSGFKGVYFHRHAKKWNALIQVDGKGLHLGSFTDPAAAARAYDAAALKHHGEFARTNFPAEGASPRPASPAGLARDARNGEVP